MMTLVSSGADPMTPHRVLLTLFRHNLAPGEVEHWDVFWEDPAGPVPQREAEDRIETEEAAFAWAPARSRNVYVPHVPHDPVGRYWAGQGPPPEADLPVWKRRSEDRRGNRE
jgi:hypothetical protein